MKILFVAVISLAHSSIINCAAALTRDEFNAAVTSTGFPIPHADIYGHFAEATNHYSREELAMLIAQLIHESGGFQFREEIACKGGNQCEWQYKDSVSLPGKSYHGRGFIQLSWGANYLAASKALGMADKLLHNPELVAQDTKLSVLVSTWYWESRVRPALKGHENQFGVTTKAINGAIECSGGWNERAAKRYHYYLKVADVMKINNKAIENGCYN